MCVWVGGCVIRDALVRCLLLSVQVLLYQERILSKVVGNDVEWSVDTCNGLYPCSIVSGAPTPHQQSTPYTTSVTRWCVDIFLNCLGWLI